MQKINSLWIITKQCYALPTQYIQAYADQFHLVLALGLADKQHEPKDLPQKL